MKKLLLFLLIFNSSLSFGSDDPCEISLDREDFVNKEQIDFTVEDFPLGKKEKINSIKIKNEIVKKTKGLNFFDDSKINKDLLGVLLPMLEKDISVSLINAPVNFKKDSYLFNENILNNFNVTFLIYVDRTCNLFKKDKL